MSVMEPAVLPLAREIVPSIAMVDVVAGAEVAWTEMARSKPIKVKVNTKKRKILSPQLNCFAPRLTNASSTNHSKAAPYQTGR